MRSEFNRDNEMRKRGFTLIEVMIAAGILSLLILVITTLVVRSLDTYGQIMSDTETIKQARQCLNQIVYEMRESTSSQISVPAEALGGELGIATDALLLHSARVSDAPGNPNAFMYDPNTFLPLNSSIILYYVFTTPEGNPQLRRLQLYYTEDDLNGFVQPFFLSPTGVYAGSNIVIVDSAGSEINIDMATGTRVGGDSPYKPPKVLINGITSFDIVTEGVSVPEVRITCRFTDRFGRSATTRLRTGIDTRNVE
jgi:prepilin-type N-terminal cleavage/methylation domain-containing protein